jgi:hypothetical protein
MIFLIIFLILYRINNKIVYRINNIFLFFAFTKFKGWVMKLWFDVVFVIGFLQGIL